MILMPSTLVTRDNVGQYKGWSAPADEIARRTRSAPRPPSEGSGMADVVAFGEVLIDFVPTVTGQDLRQGEMPSRRPPAAPPRMSPRALRASACRAPSWAWSGEDGFGRFLADTLAQAGVDISPLRFTDAAQHRARLRLPARRWRARVPVLPQPERRHADGARDRRRGGDPQPRAHFISARSA